MVFGKSKDGQFLGDIIFKPGGQFWCRVAITFDQPTQVLICAVEIRGIPDMAQFNADAFANHHFGGVMDGFLCQIAPLRTDFLAACVTGTKQERLQEYFVSGTTARCAASLVGVNFKTGAYYFHRLREIIAYHLEQEADTVFSGEIEVDESYFGGRR